MTEPFPFPPPREPVRPRPPTPPPNGGIPKRGLSDLQARLLTASVLVPYVLFVIAQGGLWVLGTVIVVMLLAQREFYGLIEDKGAHPIVGFGLAAGVARPKPTMASPQAVAESMTARPCRWTRGVHRPVRLAPSAPTAGAA